MGEALPPRQSRPEFIGARITGYYREDASYPAAIVNVTNRCNLSCKHCFVYRPGNPNEAPRSVREEPSDDTLLETLTQLRDRHGIRTMLWMGGEPLLRRELLEKGVRLFANNTITTNGTLPLADLGPEVLYVVSLDGPEDLNDAIRGRGVYRKVLRNLARLPTDFSSPFQVQCVVTKRNQNRLEELVEELRRRAIPWMTFSFYVPRAGEQSEDAWINNEERAEAVRGVMELKSRYPEFVRNSTRSLELMLPPYAKRVTDACPPRKIILPLYLEEDRFVTPFCCYGNDVDCDRCGAWAVFWLAGRMGTVPLDEPTADRR